MSAGLYRETRGQGPDLVMVHGWGMHSAVWRDFAGLLAARFRVTCVDLPGHGLSPMTGDWTLSGVAQALLDHAPPRALWLGWSLGASVAVHVAATAAERVEGLVLIAGNARFAETGAWPGMAPEALDGFARDLVHDCVGTCARFLSLQTRGLASPRGVLKTLRARLAECPPTDETALRAGLAVLRDADLRGTLPGLTCPGLLVHGMRDMLVPASAGEAMKGLWRGAQLRVIAGAAHTPFLSHADACAACVLDFAESLPQEPVFA